MLRIGVDVGGTNTDAALLKGQALRRARQKIGVVSQNPYLSLSPRLTIAEILAEPMLAQGQRPGPSMRRKIAGLLSDCGLPADFLERRARELSGGQAQRVAIARALALEPGLMILDEPTSALDVSVQAQILNLLSDLKESRGLSMLLVTHNLKAVAHISDALHVSRRCCRIWQGRRSDESAHSGIHARTALLWPSHQANTLGKFHHGPTRFLSNARSLRDKMNSRVKAFGQAMDILAMDYGAPGGCAANIGFIGFFVAKIRGLPVSFRTVPRSHYGRTSVSVRYNEVVGSPSSSIMLATAAIATIGLFAALPTRLLSGNDLRP
ncbi:ATP-binding cassette domain-containing protein [Mesorhizobium shangrilense]|uniref:ATP-binding cassette domain-containing protein n=1 Tax=Mesorhizobium shangrilense TaxID=460060 RepID=A0ABV2DPN0_9HYPH